MMVSCLLGGEFSIGVWRDEVRCWMRGIGLLAYELWKVRVNVSETWSLCA